MEKRLRLGGIQFFAEGEDSNGDDNKTIIDQLNAELSRYKSRIDEMSKNEKQYKEQLKAKMTEEEKRNQSQKEVEERIAEYERKIQNYELKETLVKSNCFTSEEIDSVIENVGDTNALLQKIGEFVQTKITNAKKEAIAEYMRESDVNGQSGDGKTKVDADVLSYVNRNKENDSTQKAREYYLNK